MEGLTFKTLEDLNYFFHMVEESNYTVPQVVTRIKDENGNWVWNVQNII